MGSPSPCAHEGSAPPRLSRTIVGLRKCVAPAVGAGVCPRGTASAINAALLYRASAGASPSMSVRLVAHGSNWPGGVTTALILSPHLPLFFRLRTTYAAAVFAISGSPDASKAIVLIR